MCIIRTSYVAVTISTGCILFLFNFPRFSGHICIFLSRRLGASFKFLHKPTPTFSILDVHLERLVLKNDLHVLCVDWDIKLLTHWQFYKQWVWRLNTTTLRHYLEIPSDGTEWSPSYCNWLPQNGTFRSPSHQDQTTTSQIPLRTPRQAVLVILLPTSPSMSSSLFRVCST